ncbi:hypothetical protein SCHPADRAFT_1002442 [Schizopora paradoxa]|uniref:Uncharacterized protein n=1 Tax=Schizopora paradoxa TaxID=27342 RepID=A0A0H2R4K7_9AGAM|nr:hypothetical protein SCHPADRAFT_1002442 [Schizopora paradoxa]
MPIFSRKKSSIPSFTGRINKNDTPDSEEQALALAYEEEERTVRKMMQRRAIDAVLPPSPGPDDPTFAPAYPRAGTWVAFKLNASFWGHLFEDEDHPMRHPDALVRFARSFQHYVGLVAGVYEVVQTHANGLEETYLEIVVLYLKPAEEDELNSPLRRAPRTRAQYEMTVPVGWRPTQGVLERKPLCSTLFLPWQRAAQMTCCGTRLRVQKMHASKLEFGVDLADFSRFEDMAETDLRTLQNLTTYRGYPKHSELDVPLLGIPADIWMDVRVCDSAFPPDPQDYLEEIRDLQKLLNS